MKRILAAALTALLCGCEAIEAHPYAPIVVEPGPRGEG